MAPEYAGQSLGYRFLAAIFAKQVDQISTVDLAIVPWKKIGLSKNETKHKTYSTADRSMKNDFPCSKAPLNKSHMMKNSSRSDQMKPRVRFKARKSNWMRYTASSINSIRRSKMSAIGPPAQCPLDDERSVQPSQIHSS